MNADGKTKKLSDWFFLSCCLVFFFSSFDSLWWSSIRYNKTYEWIIYTILLGYVCFLILHIFHLRFDTHPARFGTVIHVLVGWLILVTVSSNLILLICTKFTFSSCLCVSFIHFKCVYSYAAICLWCISNVRWLSMHTRIRAHMVKEVTNAIAFFFQSIHSCFLLHSLHCIISFVSFYHRVYMNMCVLISFGFFLRSYVYTDIQAYTYCSDV